MLHVKFFYVGFGDACMTKGLEVSSHEVPSSIRLGL